MVKEPQRLAAERQRLEEEIVSVSVQHYDVFIKSARSAFEVLQDVSGCKSVATNMWKDIESLEKGCTQFAEAGHKWKTRHSQAVHLLNNHMKLLELLEAPGLLETCLRQEMYHEALMLHDHIKTLTEANSHIPLICMLAHEMEQTMQRLLRHILNKLTTPITLPVCMKIVNFLRRLKILSEAELRNVFLSKRWQHLQALLAEATLHKQNPNTYISKITAVIKINLFDILTQYNSIFPQKDAAITADHNVPLDQPICDVVSFWVLTLLEDYISQLRKYIQLVNSGSELRTLLDQCMNCGFTLSRLQLDIRGLIGPIFTDRVVGIFQTAADHACSSFSQSLAVFAMKNARPKLNVVSDRVASSPASGEGSHQPPSSLLQCVPLGYFANGLLSGFNEIRRCCPVSAAPRCADITTAALGKVTAELLKLHKSDTFDDQDTEGFVAFIKVAVEELIPYIAKCCDTVFNQIQLLNVQTIVAPLLEIQASRLPAVLSSQDEPQKQPPPQPEPVPQQATEIEDAAPVLDAPPNAKTAEQPPETVSPTPPVIENPPQPATTTTAPPVVPPPTASTPTSVEAPKVPEVVAPVQPEPVQSDSPQSPQTAEELAAELDDLEDGWGDEEEEWGEEEELAEEGEEGELGEGA
eukprot:TRINITY_DN61045_c0_g1_i1.p1 TRINITY_DN61045_c0_g1~~TRINITY_DN61045_c0_g1_i1.p1  ORF type:complete len:650 (+),score=80.80 TRINITY_DN61045_c0_g1_i1:37-1950(+)